NLIWDVSAVDYKNGYSFTLAPLAVKNFIVVGISGGEYGIRGFIDAYDADTGKHKWRFYTVPGPGEPGHDSWEGESWKIGGAPAWIPAVMIQLRISSFGRRAILLLPIAVKAVPAKIFTATRCSLLMQTPES